jgi:protein-S-isoprenylcysteine O-methyltransferase Ste14
MHGLPCHPGVPRGYERQAWSRREGSNIGIRPPELKLLNKFFEPTVRIQTDRGHKVIDTGPYAIVRRPGYLSGFLVFIGMPLSLGSVWALIPGILLCLLLIVQTIWEDQTLRNELTGYREYAQKVRYRLIPGVW